MIQSFCITSRRCGCILAKVHSVTLWLDFNDEEQDIIDMYNTGITTYTEQMLLKFMLGQEPLSNFDTFRETLREMGVDEVLKAYESAYSRVR